MTVAHYYLLCRQYDLPLDQSFTGMPAELGPAVVAARDDHGRPVPRLDSSAARLLLLRFCNLPKEKRRAFITVLDNLETCWDRENRS